jgi:sugar diacid utilization regulator
MAGSYDRFAFAGDIRMPNQQVATLKELLLRSLQVTQWGDEADILRLLAHAAEAVTSCWTEGILLDRAWCDAGRGGQGFSCDAVAAAGRRPGGGRIVGSGAAWAWVYPMPTGPGQAGYLVVGAAKEPAVSDRQLLAALASQAGVAIANARMRLGERSLASELRATNLDLRRSIEIQERITEAAMRGGGQNGIARAVYGLTGHSVGIEDAFGSLVTWAGPAAPDAHPRVCEDSRSRMLDRLMSGPGPVRDGRWLISLATVAGVPVGAVVLADPDRTAADTERVAVERAAWVLGLEVERVHAVGESRAHAHANLVLELVSGADEPDVLSRAQALGCDLRRPHRVVVLEGEPGSGDATEVLFHAVGKAAQALAIGSLMAIRSYDVIVLTDREVPWERFHADVAAESGGARCSMGVGGQCLDVADFRRSHREAQLALRIQKAIGAGDKVTVFDDLGVYQVLASEADTSAMESFVKDWLSDLIDYDADHGSELVKTLGEFLDCGGSYERAAAALAVHRSTLKYRLKRIKQVSGHDLGVPDTQFNLQVATRAWRTLHALRGGP